MTDARTANDDIDYIRKLAESGAHAPLTGGRFLIWWGLLLSIAYGAHHLGLRGMIGHGESIFGWIWLTFSIAGGIGQFVLARSMSGKPGSGSAGNRASRTVWTGAAAVIASMVVGTIVAASRGAGPATFDWIVPVGFAVYACALIVTGGLAKSRVTMAAGAGAVIMVGLFTAMILSPDRYLIAAAGVFLTVFVPGVLMFMAEPRSQG
jgi:hypothetical protein